MREWTSLLSKALSLSINCKRLKLFPKWSRHRSHHTQKVVPNVVAGHQFLYTSPDNGIFPITRYVQAHVRKNVTFQQQVHTLGKPLLGFRVDFFLMVKEWKIVPRTRFRIEVWLTGKITKVTFPRPPLFIHDSDGFARTPVDVVLLPPRWVLRFEVG